MKTLLAALILVVCIGMLRGQQSVDGDFAFQSDPAKKYSLYIPTSYDADSAHRLMLALHPFNTNRWDAESWRDTLIAFAEMTQLILVCPDGGPDGQVDDAIDTAFTTALLDSVHTWYNVHPNKQYVMGFSWGGLTTYTYGLRRTHTFSGFMPIGAAINGSGPINAFVQNADSTPWYLVHGSNDAPNTRFTPLKQALENNGALVNDTLMPGIGHTIDFPDRNQILANAFFWIDSVNCTAAVSDTSDTAVTSAPQHVMNDLQLIQSGKQFTIKAALDLKNPQIHLYSMNGSILTSQALRYSGNQWESASLTLRPGAYIVRVLDGGEEIASKVMVWP